MIFTVFGGPDSLTMFVATIVSIDGGVLLAGVVTVSILFEVCIRVIVANTGTAGDVGVEPPSTATTEYGTRLPTAGCLGGAWGFSGKAWEGRFEKESADITIKDVRRMVYAI